MCWLFNTKRGKAGKFNLIQHVGYLKVVKLQTHWTSLISLQTFIVNKFGQKGSSSGGGLMVRVLPLILWRSEFVSRCRLQFISKNVVEKNENKQKEARVDQF